MTTLWSLSSEATWATIWARYDTVVQSMENDLAALDKWYLASLPPILQGREPTPYLTQSELQQVLKWKLKKGKWRPQLMKFISELSEVDVKQASLKAYKELKRGDLRAATEAFCVLKGVGPATASALLAVYDERVPFMADEALEAIAAIIGPRKYTLPHFMIFAEQLRNKAEWLNEQRAATNDEKAEKIDFWTAQRVQLCLYVEAHNQAATKSVSNTKKEASTVVKRKRDKTMMFKKSETICENPASDHDHNLRRSRRKRVGVEAHEKIK